MHQCVTHNRRYPTQKQFADAILKFFRETLPNEWQEHSEAKCQTTSGSSVTRNFGFWSEGGIQNIKSKQYIAVWHGHIKERRATAESLDVI